jgi:hypothetical protein
MDDVLTPEDDDFHASDRHWWWHETCFYYFMVPERGLGCWLYNYIRPTIGVSGGGCWVWDDRTFFHMEAPYYACYSALQLPEERDLRDFRFPSGVGVKALEPLRTYHLTHTDRDWIDVDVLWDAIQQPWVRAVGDPPVPSHWEQFGHVTGTLTLRGEPITVDCLAMRDRTWSPRGERWKDGGGAAYASAAASADLNILATGGDRIGGFATIDGERRALTDGTRTVERHADHGYVTHIELRATDTLGRELHAVGSPVSRMAMPLPGINAVVWTSTVRWNINGIDCWGEDQDPWPLGRWAELRRAQAPAGLGAPGTPGA